MKKDILIKVFRPSGEFLADWSNIAKFEGFSKEVNAGLGQCILELGVPFDYAGGELDLNNTIEISIADEDTKINGWKLIYSGYISLITPYVQGKREGIEVCLLGEYTRLSTDIMKTSETIVHYSDSTNGITTTAPGDEADIAVSCTLGKNTFQKYLMFCITNSSISSITGSIGSRICLVFFLFSKFITAVITNIRHVKAV